MRLLRAEEVVCRAWDEAMNTQPDTFTWNLMGMLNNCHYRVKVRHCSAQPAEEHAAFLCEAQKSSTSSIISENFKLAQAKL